MLDTLRRFKLNFCTDCAPHALLLWINEVIQNLLFKHCFCSVSHSVVWSLGQIWHAIYSIISKMKENNATNACSFNNFWHEMQIISEYVDQHTIIQYNFKYTLFTCQSTFFHQIPKAIVRSNLNIKTEWKNNLNQVPWKELILK